MTPQIELPPVEKVSPTPPAVGKVERGRILSLDQFRGYTVLGMFVVNFLASCTVIPAVLKHHHTYFSYADSIMPQFFLAVGFAYRLTLLRRLETAGPAAAYWHVVRRNLGLILLGIVFHKLDGRVQSWEELQRLGVWGFVGTAFQRSPFQTLVHIGVASLWVMPVIARDALARIAYAAMSAGLFVVFSYWFYYDWVMGRPGIDGGPLGFLTWSIPLLAGSLACDWVLANKPFAAAGRLLAAGAVLMLLGYGLSCLNRVAPPYTGYEKAQVEKWEATQKESLSEPESPWAEPPFEEPTRPVSLWTMSQRAGSVSYLTFAAGFSLAVYALFVLACDLGRLRVWPFATLGGNALAAYLIHDVVSDAVKPYVPKDAPLWYVLAAFAVFFAICYVFLRYLEKRGMYLRL